MNAGTKLLLFLKLMGFFKSLNLKLLHVYEYKHFSLKHIHIHITDTFLVLANEKCKL